ncbi:MAG TPA: SAM-dependent chlorinase/fluorinase [Burkholderiales bacterium]
MLFLYTDYGASDLYLGQVHAVLESHAPGLPRLDLLNDAPSFNVRASAHLLAALAGRYAPGSVFLAVVDPGVGSERAAAVLEADGRFFVGPDNGLLSVVATRAEQRRFWHITWRPDALSDSFHGRDLFAPIAAWIARGAFPTPRLRHVSGLDCDFGGEDLAEVIYIDHYGNAMTGLQGPGLARNARILAQHRHLPYARVFSEVPKGEPFWHENSIGLAEIAVNSGHAARELGLAIGQHVIIVTDA